MCNPTALINLFSKIGRDSDTGFLVTDSNEAKEFQKAVQGINNKELTWLMICAFYETDTDCCDMLDQLEVAYSNHSVVDEQPAS
jgi:hypothetical protein